ASLINVIVGSAIERGRVGIESWFEQRIVPRGAVLPHDSVVVIKASAGREHIPIAISGPPDGQIGLSIAIEITVLNGNITCLAPLIAGGIVVQRPVEAATGSPDIPRSVTWPPNSHVCLTVAIEIAVLKGDISAHSMLTLDRST